MNDNKVTMLGFLFFLFCASLMGGIFYLDKTLAELKENYNELEQSRVDLEQTTASLVEQKKIFTAAFETLEQYEVGVASSDMGFYSSVQQIVESSGVSIMSTRQQGVSQEGRSSMALTLRGNYYSLMHVLASWRNLPVTVRVSTMSLTSPRGQGSGDDIQADVTVETIISTKK